MKPIWNSAFITLSLFSGAAFAQDNRQQWFNSYSPVATAHQALLEGDFSKSFSAMVEAWQLSPEPYVKEHLDALLTKALEKDCGKYFEPVAVAPWLNTITIQRQIIQSPGRTNYRLALSIQSKEQVEKLTFSKWPDQALIDGSNVIGQLDGATWNYNTNLERNARLDSGIYKLEIETEKGQEWESWVLLSKPDIKQQIRWDGKESWRIDKSSLLNRYCPLPVLEIGLYGNVDKQYQPVWKKGFESNYPTAIPEVKLPPNRYLVEVSMTHKRWQGVILIEDKQIITKTYDISEE